jgi:nucleolar protein 56
MKEKQLREKFIEIAKKKIEEKKKRNDLYIIQLNRALEDLYVISNKISERLVEWAFLYNINEKNPKKVIEHIKALANEAKNEKDKEKGIDLLYGKEQLNALLSFAQLFEKIQDEIEQKEQLLEKYAAQIMPNSYELIGGKLVAKYLSIAGSMEKLADMPSSTIQVLGAEKALFKHLRAKTKPPKHGIILLSHYVNKLPKHKRGKMARTLAAKLAIAFKADLAGHYIGKQLKEAVEKRFKELSKNSEKKQKRTFK